MQILRATLETFEKKILLIGYQGENECTQVRIDASDVFAEYPNATPSMIIRPFSGDGFPCFVARDGNEVVWEITSTILSFRGDGEAQLTFIKDSVVKKSAVGNIRVRRSLAVTGETPSPVAQWISDDSVSKDQLKALYQAFINSDSSGLDEQLMQVYSSTMKKTMTYYKILVTVFYIYDKKIFHRKD